MLAQRVSALAFSLSVVGFAALAGSKTDSTAESAATALAESSRTDSSAARNAASSSPALARLGERVYMKNCANCHRADGRGGPQPTATGNPAPNFRSPEFWKGMTDDSLRAATENGVPNSAMVAWKGILSREEILAVTAFVRERFEPKRGDSAAAGAATGRASLVPARDSTGSPADSAARK